MGIFSKDIQTMQDLFLHQLQDVYYAENQILKALPKMISKATDQQLKQSFQTHLKETETHVSRLERVFRLLGETAKQIDCPTINGLVQEANEVSGDVANKQVLDAALISSAQAVEHYEITRYGTLVTWASELGRSEIASLLRLTLEEERATDRKLTRLAEARLNNAAIHAAQDRDDEGWGRGYGYDYANRTGQSLSWLGEHPELLATAAVAGAIYMYLRQKNSSGPVRHYSGRTGVQRRSVSYYRPNSSVTETRRYEHATYPEA